MAPVAARLSLGLPPDRVGPRQKDWVRLHWPEATLLDDSIEGEVVAVAPMGRLIGDDVEARARLVARPLVHLGEREAGRLGITGHGARRSYSPPR